MIDLTSSPQKFIDQELTVELQVQAFGMTLQTTSIGLEFSQESREARKLGVGATVVDEIDESDCRSTN